MHLAGPSSQERALTDREGWQFGSHSQLTWASRHAADPGPLYRGSRPGAVLLVPYERLSRFGSLGQRPVKALVISLSN
jgi:hypothetical protein